MGFYLKSKISQNKEILRLFCKDLEASKISSLTGVSKQCLCGLLQGCVASEFGSNNMSAIENFLAYTKTQINLKA